MLEISILKIQDPGCFWGRIVKGAGLQLNGPKEYENLQVEMNLFYHEFNLDNQKIKLPSLTEDQVCVVYSPTLRSWCRAVVESVFMRTGGCQVMCFLVDYADHIIVSLDSVRALLERFLQLPFLVRKFQLAGIHPMKLHVPICEEMAKLIPSTHWDSSATRYLCNLVQASSLSEAMPCGILGDSTAVELYLTIGNVKICVNDDLVTKRFAYSSSEKTAPSSHNCGDDPSLVMLACDIYSSTNKVVSQNGCVTQALWYSLRKDLQDIKPGASQTVGKDSKKATLEMSQGAPDLGAGEPSKYQPLEMGANAAADFAVNGDVAESFTDSGRSSDTENLSLEGNQTGASNTVDPAGDEEDHENRVMSITEWVGLEEELDFTRLLQWLNPDPLNLDAEFSDITSVHCEPSRSRILVHSAIPIEPCTSLACSPITDSLRKALIRKGYRGLDVAECYSWPAVAQGCDTVLISSSGADPMTYMPPFLSHLQLSNTHTVPNSHSGPIAVILCQGWEKAQHVFDLLEDSPATKAFSPMIVLVGLGKDEAKSIKIERNCQVLVTTPFSLVRLLGFHRFLFLRLCHLVLDEVDVLCSRAPEEVSAVLQHFHKVAASEERGVHTKQIIAVAKRWSKQVEALVKEHMIDPCIIITVMEEAALYGSVHQMVLLCLDCTKISVLLSALDFIPDVAQKTLIVTNSAKEVEHVYKAVINTSAYCLKFHEGLTYQFDFVIEQWRKDIGRGTHVILVVSNECMKTLGIRDATCVVHYGFPSSPGLFGSRLYCMSENFQNLCVKDCGNPTRIAKSMLLLSEKNTRHVIGVLRYLERAEAMLPPELVGFAQGVLQAKDKQKTDRPLCSYLKSFGFCRDSRVCPDRHSINPKKDTPQHPDSGGIVILPLYIKNASCYYGRIVSRKEDRYENLAAQMLEYYASEKFSAKKVEKGGLYGIQEDGAYHRVQVLIVPDNGEQLVCSVRVHFLDDGRKQDVKAHQLLMLPSHFQNLPPQAVEIILCRAKPLDGEVDWNPKVNRHISQKIKGVKHQATVVLSLGNTIWVDFMVRVTHLPGLKTSINEYSVRSEILATGMGTDNPRHVDLLQELCKELGVSDRGKPIPSIMPEAPGENLESRLTRSEEALAKRLKASAESLQPVQETSADTLEDQLQYPAPSREHEPQPSSGILRSRPNVRLCNSDMPFSQLNATVGTSENRLHVPTAFQDPAVTPLACVDGRHYYADLELCSTIIPDKSTWDVKCSKPVIRPMKEEVGVWNMLLKQKSAFVTSDFDLLEEQELKLGNVGTEMECFPVNKEGYWFMGCAGEEGCYVGSDSDSD
ncbi:putative ATP-dependent RNA helicase TDRD12 [Megalops cyprinoides]|uniref:putative ATP-dependent RNA helicase TDRD12 n=1 Tax=Megalops cyprinoides TaxID=118141 RepID=UPI001864AFB5|nr:putative ATP-dependent RNA helicase TDRD12 [Megalops cyprinoides]